MCIKDSLWLSSAQKASQDGYEVLTTFPTDLEDMTISKSIIVAKLKGKFMQKYLKLWWGAWIRVNSIHPGVIVTPMVVQEDVVDSVEKLGENIPLKRGAELEDASYSTGSEFVIDGGLIAKF